MGGGGKSGSAGKQYDYYGSIGGILCCGPVDAILAIQVDAKTVWPTAKFWDKNKSYAKDDVVSYAGRAYKATLPAAAGVEPPAAPWAVYSVPRVWTDDVGVVHTQPNPYHITVEKYGEIDFYWGTPNQDLLTDPKATHPRNHFIAQGHPPYRNQCFFLMWNFLWGRERQGAPNIEFVLRRRPASPLAASINDLDADGQANPLAVELELLTHPIFGAGLPPARFSPAVDVEAAKLQADKAAYYISPALHEQAMLRSVIGESVAYRDGWWRFDANGLFEPGLWPRSQAAPVFDFSNTVDDSVLIGEIALAEHDWSETASEAITKYTNAVLAYNSDAVKATSGYSKVVVGEVRQKEIDRPWVLRAAQASRYAQEYLKTISEPWYTGTFKMRRTRCPGVVPGALFLLKHSFLGIAVVCRCLSRNTEQPKDGAVTIKFESDRGLAPQPYSIGVSTEPPARFGDVELITAFHVVQLPPSFAGGEGNNVGVIAARHQALTTGLSIWLKAQDASLFYELGSQRQFAVRGTLAQAYAANLPPAGTSPPDDDSGSLLVYPDPETVATDLKKIEETQGKDHINDNNLLLWVISKTNPALMEIMTVKSVALVADVPAPGLASYAVKVRRFRYGLGPFAFAKDDYAYFIHRADVPPYTHEAFSTYMRTGSPAIFRLVSSNPAAEGDETDATEYTEVEFFFADPYGPTATWAWLKVNEVTVTDFTQEFKRIDTFGFHLDATDPTGDLIDVSVVGNLGGLEVPILSSPISPSSGYSVNGGFVPSAIGMPEGDWAINAVVRDKSGRVRRVQLTATPGGATVYLKIRSNPGQGVVPPVATPPSGPYQDRTTFAIGLATSTAGAAIVYQLTPIDQADATGGIPENGNAAWLVYSAEIVFTVAVGYKFGKRIFAACRTGSAGNFKFSSVVSFPYWAEAS